jgi:hypothetical protein
VRRLAGEGFLKGAVATGVEETTEKQSKFPGAIVGEVADLAGAAFSPVRTRAPSHIAFESLSLSCERGVNWR